MGKSPVYGSNAPPRKADPSLYVPSPAKVTNYAYKRQRTQGDRRTPLNELTNEKHKNIMP